MLFEFGHRTIQKVGYSYLIPLPTYWVKNMNIDKGDSLKIEMSEDKALRITPVSRNRQEPQKLEANTSK
ncbi:AbrB/MazE/SpoVT family DNA-binding domain-containing protein [Methanosarcina soligelidi]|uniref:AbrB/MazE/SpoVT family DNA-binding domain-containing protein n=1 Tax=Methanosarcina soligelidi TaxID=1036677 RepID=UPI00064F2EA9|nr:AbrB/MazE/SpoVT family DNA-binding domain-containing protein [Methanosarcina soligelidi]